MFSLVSGLSSTASADGLPLLFGCFAGTTPLYDSPPPCMWVLWLIAFSHRSAALQPRTVTGSLGSRAWSFYACVGSLTPQGRGALALSHIAFLRLCARIRQGPHFMRLSQRRRILSSLRPGAGPSAADSVGWCTLGRAGARS